MIRLLFSMTHFWARRRILARPSNPIASHSGCALRARATISLTSSSDIAGTWVITSPVAGFSTGMPAAPSVDAAVGLDSTVAMASPSLGRCRKPTRYWPASQEAGGSEPVEDAGPLGVVLGRGDHAVVAEFVELAQARRDGVGGRRAAAVRSRPGRGGGRLDGHRVPGRRRRAGRGGWGGARDRGAHGAGRRPFE